MGLSMDHARNGGRSFLQKEQVRSLLKDRHDLVRSKAKQRDKELLEQERASNYGRDIGFLQEQEQEHAVKWSGQIRHEALSNPIALTHNIVPRVIPQIHSWINTYGKNYLTWQGNQAQLVISETEIIKDVLKNNSGAFLKIKDDSTFLYKITGNGLVSSEGAKWATQRKLANHAFHGESLKVKL
ncbi:hypothetical protein V6N11_083494 [Hibiscus sabdariffa]|uniref:Cytochrome P450 n=1 Tax=Hibiscus sabdariffa TaxID=183260 RepID=A0ABR2QMI4_9ROSI